MIYEHWDPVSQFHRWWSEHKQLTGIPITISHTEKSCKYTLIKFSMGFVKNSRKLFHQQDHLLSGGWKRMMATSLPKILLINICINLHIHEHVFSKTGCFFPNHNHFLEIKVRSQLLHITRVYAWTILGLCSSGKGCHRHHSARGQRPRNRLSTLTTSTPTFVLTQSSYQVRPREKKKVTKGDFAVKKLKTEA